MKGEIGYGRKEETGGRDKMNTSIQIISWQKRRGSSFSLL